MCLLKPKVMTFNITRNLNFPPEVRFPGSELLEVVEKSKVLGIILTNDLKWSENTDYLVTKAMKCIWTIRRLKNLKLDREIILDVYNKEMRVILEFGVPIWNGSITLADSDKLESVQKKVFKLILQKEYVNYEQACDLLKVKNLKQRREQLCHKFARKEMKKENSMFEKFQPNRINRHTHKKIVKEFSCNTERFYNSSLPYLARMINAKHANKYV